jgi:transposase
MNTTRYREIIRLHSLGKSPAEIAASVGCDRGTASRAVKTAEEAGLTWPLPDELGDVGLKRLLYPGKYGPRGAFRQPDYGWVHRELKRKGVTRSLLYEEYCDSCRASGESPCSASTFNNGYAEWSSKQNIVMHIQRKPGEKMEVDWAGTKMQVTERTTGEILDVYVFVACLPFSGKLYAEGFFKMDSECWLTAHVHSFDYYGGVCAELVPTTARPPLSSMPDSSLSSTRPTAIWLLITVAP